MIICTNQKIQPIKNSIIFYLTFKDNPRSKDMRSTEIPYMTYYIYMFHVNVGHNMHHSADTAHYKLNKAIRDGRPRPPRHQVGWDIPLTFWHQIPNLYDHSFPRYGQITFLTFRRPTTLTFDLKFWKYLSVTVYPYVICMPSFIMIGWEMADDIIHWNFAKTRTNKHTHKHTNKQTDRQTWALQYLALPLWGAR